MKSLLRNSVGRLCSCALFACVRACVCVRARVWVCAHGH